MASKAAPPQGESAGWWDESASPAGHTGRRQSPRVDYHHTPHNYHNNTTYDDDTRSGVGFWDRVARIIVAILLPPLGVFFQTGCNKDLAINVLLTLLGCVFDQYTAVLSSNCYQKAHHVNVCLHMTL